MLVQLIFLAVFALFVGYVLPRLFPTATGRQNVVIRMKAEDQQAPIESTIVSGGFGIVGGTSKRSHARAELRKDKAVPSV
jgi:hypothetical protein